MTELREQARKQKAELERRMMGEGSDEEEEKEEKDGEGEVNKGQSKSSNEDSGCSWGMGEPFCCHRTFLSAVLTYCFVVNIGVLLSTFSDVE